MTIRCVICDFPARSFVKCTKGFNAYFDCSKCIHEGDYLNHRMLFLEMASANLRTDENFVNQENEEHQEDQFLKEQM